MFNSSSNATYNRLYIHSPSKHTEKTPYSHFNRSDTSDLELNKLKNEMQRYIQEVSGYKIYKEVMDKNIVKLQDALSKLQTDKENLIKQMKLKDIQVLILFISSINLFI